MLASHKVRRLIRYQESFYFEVKDDDDWRGRRLPEGVDVLHFRMPGFIDHKERLGSLLELFVATLNRLCTIGSASRAKPGVLL
jgi:hypothetical protein